MTDRGRSSAHGIPLGLLLARRAIISLTSGENSIQTKKAVATQTASLTSVTTSP